MFKLINPSEGLVRELLSCFCQVYTHLYLIRRDFQVFCHNRVMHATSAKKGWKYSGKELSAGLMLHAACSQVVILHVHHHKLAGKFSVVQAWSLILGVTGITSPYLSKLEYYVYKPIAIVL